MSLVFETATGEGNRDKYQTLQIDGSNKPKIVDKSRRRRKFFWWLRWGQGKPHDLESYERHFQWQRDFQKPLKMLCYPHVCFNPYQAAHYASKDSSRLTILSIMDPICISNCSLKSLIFSKFSIL